MTERLVLLSVEARKSELDAFRKTEVTTTMDKPLTTVLEIIPHSLLSEACNCKIAQFCIL